MRVKLFRVPYFMQEDGSHRVETSFLPPLGMVQAAAFLRRRGFVVEQDDLNIRFHRSRFVKLVNKHRPCRGVIKKVVEDFVGALDLGGMPDAVLLSSCWPYFEVNHILTEELCRVLRGRFDCKIIVGGNRCFEAENFFSLLREGVVDFVIKGGPSLVEEVLFKSKVELRGVEGVAFEDGGEIFFRKLTVNDYLLEVPDLCGLPLDLYRWNPDRAFVHPLLEGVDRNPDILVIPIAFIKGCVQKCAFCSSSSSKAGFLALEPKKVVDSLEFLSKRYSTPFFMFLNDSLNFSNDYTRELCEEILRRDLKIFWSDSVSTINLENRTLKLMRDAGCIRLFFGLETASQKLLNYIDKKVSLSRFSDVIKFSSNLGIWTGIDLICGLPYETDEDISQTIRFVNSQKEYIDAISLFPFRIKRFSRFYNEPEKFGLKIRECNPKVLYHKRAYFMPKSTAPTNIFFDEVYGLSWPEKQKQIEESYRRVFSEINSQTLIYEDFFFLCWLYMLGYSKENIKKVYGYIYARLMRKKYFRLGKLISEFFKIRSLSDLKYPVYLIKNYRTYIHPSLQIRRN